MVTRLCVVVAMVISLYSCSCRDGCLAISNNRNVAMLAVCVCVCVEGCVRL